jgi:hypothetical protein
LAVGWREIEQAGGAPEHRATDQRGLAIGVPEVELAMPAGGARARAETSPRTPHPMKRVASASTTSRTSIAKLRIGRIGRASEPSNIGKPFAGAGRELHNRTE